MSVRTCVSVCLCDCVSARVGGRHSTATPGNPLEIQHTAHARTQHTHAHTHTCTRTQQRSITHGQARGGKGRKRRGNLPSASACVPIAQTLAATSTASSSTRHGMASQFVASTGLPECVHPGLVVCVGCDLLTCSSVCWVLAHLARTDTKCTHSSLSSALAGYDKQVHAHIIARQFKKIK